MSVEIQTQPSGGGAPCCKSGGCSSNSRQNSVASRPMTPMHQEPLIDTIFKACAYGDIDKLRNFVESDPSLVNTPDAQGFFPLQWGTLNNRVGVCNYLIENNANVNAIDGLGQTALHWAGVRGSLSAAEVLLRANAQVEICDTRGYTVCHVAAQYGQTAFLYHLALQWSADFERPDRDGRTSLHWAAYKGFGDLIRLLVFMDASIDRKDKEGCTPLHWAAIVGNGEAATLLLQGGSVEHLDHRDVTGSTPAELATEKGHRFLGMHLKEWREKHSNGALFGKNGALRWVTALHLCPVIWAIVLGLLSTFTFWVVNSPAFPRASAATGLWSHAVLISSFSGLYFLYKTTTADPGFLPKGSCGSYRSRSAGSDDEMAEAPNKAGGPGGSSNPGGCASSSSEHVASSAFDNPALRAGQWQQLCVTCKIVRPLRAKHCAVTDRCVEHFDHFCPWVGNCIGKGNRHYFFVFLVLESIAILISLAIAGVRVHAYAGVGRRIRLVGMTLPVIFIVFDFFMLISVMALTVAQGAQIARNVTTNEMANWHRYKYLKKADGTFRNPFDRGLLRNCLEVLLPGSQSRPPVVMLEDPLDPLETGRLLDRSA